MRNTTEIDLKAVNIFLEKIRTKSIGAEKGAGAEIISVISNFFFFFFEAEQIDVLIGNEFL